MAQRFSIYIVILLVAIVAFDRLYKTQHVSQQPSTQEFISYLNNKGIGAQTSFGSFDRLLSYASEWMDTGIKSVLGAIAPTPLPVPLNFPEVKGNFSIAFLGDSMIDTLGPEVSSFKSELKKFYPKATFSIHNAGVGGKDIEDGLARLTNNYSYLGVDKPAVLSLNPDILVVESFAYNHWSDSEADLSRHWLALAHIVDVIKSNSPKTKIILATTIAPHCPTYTDGSANLPPERKYNECTTVKKYLENIIKFAASQKYPLADSYHASLDGSGEGKPVYINQGDHIHPSGEGGKLFAGKVVEVIVANRLLQ